MSEPGIHAVPSANDPFAGPDSLFNRLEGWTWIGCYGGYYLSSDLLAEAGFEQGFFTRRWQGREPNALTTYLSAGVTVHRPRQVHGSTVLNASKADHSPWPDADGLVSDRGSQSLWVCGADCTPVLIADPLSGHVAACHAGWRGVAGRILPEAISHLEERGGDRGQLLVALGPAVSGPNYQVEESVAAQVRKSLTGDSRVDEPTEVSALLDQVVQLDEEAGHCRLDIRAAAALQLMAAGVAPAHISRCPLCTVAKPDLFHSWRRDQVKAVQWSGIVSQAPD